MAILKWLTDIFTAAEELINILLAIIMIATIGLVLYRGGGWKDGRE